MVIHPSRFIADAEFAPVPLPDPASRPLHGPAARAQLRARLKRRAILEALALALPVALLPALFSQPLDALLAALAAGGAALVLWIARRGADLVAAATQLRAPDAAFQARGIPLGEWHGGAPLAPWGERRIGA